MPHLQQTVLDTPDVPGLAEFYRRLLDLAYRPGDEPPAAGEPDDADWLVLTEADGTSRLAFQLVPGLTPTTWPSHEVPMQLHLDITVEDEADLERQRARAEALGATLLLHGTDEPEEPLYLMADPSGHPFCLFPG